MRTAKFYVFCSLSATKLQGMLAVGNFFWSMSATKLQGMVAVGGINVVVVVRQSAGYDAMRCVKYYFF